MDYIQDGLRPVGPNLPLDRLRGLWVKTTIMSCINNVFSCNILVGDKLAFTLQKIRCQMSPRPPLSNYITILMVIYTFLQYLALSTCDPIAF